MSACRHSPDPRRWAIRQHLFPSCLFVDNSFPAGSQTRSLSFASAFNHQLHSFTSHLPSEPSHAEDDFGNEKRGVRSPTFLPRIPEPSIKAPWQGSAYPQIRARRVASPFPLKWVREGEGRVGVSGKAGVPQRREKRFGNGVKNLRGAPTSRSCQISSSHENGCLQREDGACFFLFHPLF